MKKMLRIAAALAALLAMTNFIGCKNDDDDDGDVATVAVDKVEITSTETDVEVGKTITLTAKVSPENATDKTVTWTSDNNEVATVKDGVVTGVKAGEATITASAGGKNATVKVTVKAAATSGGETTTIAVTEVKITSTVTEVKVGETITLTAEVLPADATNKTVAWTSSDNTVATVKDGVVTGVKAGETTITASAGGKNATVKVTVKAAATSGGETGGETGGSTGGETGGETGTTTGFENTYWVLEEEVSDVSGIKITLKNIVYTYIKDSTNGTIYFANIDSAMEELIKTDGGTRTVTYEGATGDEFKYTVDGKNITLTATAEGKTTLTGTIVDENTLKITDNSDGEPIEYTLKKATAAPTEATVTVEITAVPSTKVLDVAYDLTKDLPAAITTTDAFISADWAAPTAAPETNDITWTWVATSTRKVKNNGGLQVSNGSSAEDMITLSADSDFTVTVTYKFAGAYAADKIRCITVGDESDSMTTDTDRNKEYTLTTTAAKTATIAMNGMKLLKVETKAAN